VTALRKVLDQPDASLDDFEIHVVDLETAANGLQQHNRQFPA